MSDLLIPRDIRELSHQRAPRFHNIMNAALPGQIEIGQIWTTHSHLELPDGRCFETSTPKMVVVLEGEGDPSEFLDQIAVAPVSLSVQMASVDDLIIAESVSPLGFSFLVEVWNETPIIKGHLKRFVGKLPNKAVAVLRSLYAAALLDEELPPTVSQWVGVRIVSEEDPRLAFQENEIVATAYLSQAAAAALTSEMAVVESVGLLGPFAGLHLVFKLPIQVGKVFDFTNTAVACAAGVAGDEEAYFVSEVGEEANFTLELLVSRLSPYMVYLVVHQISPEIEGHKCIVTLQAPSGSLQSAPSELRVGAEILLGMDPAFSPVAGQMVKIAIIREEATNE